jgi:hypothetical protein
MIWNKKGVFLIFIWFYFAVHGAVLERFPDKTTANTGAVCSPYINHSDMGICTPPDSQWCIQTSSRNHPN